MQNVTKIPFFWLVTLWYPGGDIDKIYILSKSRGFVAAKPFLKKKQTKKTTFFPFLYFFFTFQDENSQKERYGNERRYKFSSKMWKKTMKGKNDFFFKKGRGNRALQLQASVVETQWNETIIVVKGPLPPRSRCHILTRFL